MLKKPGQKVCSIRVRFSAHSFVFNSIFFSSPIRGGTIQHTVTMLLPVSSFRFDLLYLVFEVVIVVFLWFTSPSWVLLIVYVKIHWQREICLKVWILDKSWWWQEKWAVSIESWVLQFVHFVHYTAERRRTRRSYSAHQKKRATITESRILQLETCSISINRYDVEK